MKNWMHLLSFALAIFWTLLANANWTSGELKHPGGITQLSIKGNKLTVLIPQEEEAKYFRSYLADGNLVMPMDLFHVSEHKDLQTSSHYFHLVFQPEHAITPDHLHSLLAILRFEGAEGSLIIKSYEQFFYSDLHMDAEVLNMMTLVDPKLLAQILLLNSQK